MTNNMSPRSVHASSRGVLRRIGAAWRSLATDNKAVSAVEFAILLPMLLVLYIGGSETGQAISIYRKVSLTSYTLADLVSQYSGVCTTSNSNSAQVGSLPDLLSISTSVMLPYAASGAQMVVAGISNKSGSNNVDWSYGLNATSWTTNAAPPTGVTVASSVVPNNGDQVIVVQTTYTYTSSFSTVMKDIWGNNGAITLTSTSFVRPRLQQKISIQSC